MSPTARFKLVVKSPVLLALFLFSLQNVGRTQSSLGALFN